MSIQSEINRLIQAKENIISAITSKGVTVPVDASMDDLTALVQAIETDSDPILQEKTVSPTTSQQTVTPDAAYDGLSKVTVNAMPTATQATPSISVSSGGLITASATQTAGYVSAGTKSATKQLTTQAAKTVTPSTSNQTAVANGVYTTGAVTVAGDANLVAGNIKSGVSIFGVAGSYEGSGGGASLETCTVTITAGSTIYSITYMTVDANGAPIYACITPNSNKNQTLTCLCNSAIAISHSLPFEITTTNFQNCSRLHSRAYFCSAGLGNRDADISITDQSGGGI